jgi:hypothetical protein
MEKRTPPQNHRDERARKDTGQIYDSWLKLLSFYLQLQIAEGTYGVLPCLDQMTGTGRFPCNVSKITLATLSLLQCFFPVICLHEIKQKDSDSRSSNPSEINKIQRLINL